MNPNADSEVCTPPLTDSEEEFLEEYRPSNKASAPPKTRVHSHAAVPTENSDCLTYKEIRHLEHLDTVLLDHLVCSPNLKETSEELLACRELSKENPIIETCDLFEEVDFENISKRELYYNIIKKKRVMLSAIHYNKVVDICMKTGSRVGKFNDEDYAKMYAYHLQLDYLSSPVWMTLASVDSNEDINPFFILEGMAYK
jgi:hypothetical protein